LNCFINSNYGKRPIYLTLDIIETEPDIAQDYEKAATGFAFKLLKKGEVEKVKVDDMDISKFKYSIVNNTGHLVEGIRSITVLNFVNIARYTLKNGDREAARKALEKAFEIDPNNQFVLDAINNFKRF